MFSQFIDGLYASVCSVPFDTLICIVWGTFIGITLLVFILCFCIPAVRAAGKRPYLCLVNAYAAITLAAYLTKEGLAQSVLAAALFWFAGYLLFGMLCAVTAQKSGTGEIYPSAISLMQTQPARSVPRADVPAAKSSVRLEHAMSVTDRLLQRNLGKSDRQDLEKLKATLSVLQMKGELTPSESEVLNDNFNALLKLMAKYNL